MKTCRIGQDYRQISFKYHVIDENFWGIILIFVFYFADNSYNFHKARQVKTFMGIIKQD